jgi:hypothetical protein
MPGPSYTPPAPPVTFNFTATSYTAPAPPVVLDLATGDTGGAVFDGRSINTAVIS